MSIFYCESCHALRDSDEGCEEVNGELVCQRCAERLDDIEAAEAELFMQRMTEQRASK
jgi:hypothetical protein